MSVPRQVLVNFEYDYTARDGSTVSIKPNEHYILVAKTNENWWHVRRDETAKPFFIPATYVTELPAQDGQTPLDPPEEFSGWDSSDGTVEVSLRDPLSIKSDTEKDGHRISTFIIPKDFFSNSVRLQTEELRPEVPIYDTADGIAHENNRSSKANGQTSQTIFSNAPSSVDENLNEDLQGLTDNNIDTVTKGPHTESNPVEIQSKSGPASVPPLNQPERPTVRHDGFSSSKLLCYYIKLL